MLSDDLETLNGVRTGQVKVVCVACGQRAVIMRREAIPDGAELGIDPKTGRPAMFEKFKPGPMQWYCRVHAPPAAVPMAAFEPKGMESR